MNKTNLYLIAALIWGIPGIIISVKGIRAYLSMAPESLWWLLLITAAVIVGFHVLCMTCLGIVLKFIPGIPAAFTASFYSGLGPMLVVAAIRFIHNRQIG